MAPRSSVLITCGGKWVGMVLQMRQAMNEVRELASGSLVVADLSTVTPAGYFADRSITVPPINDDSYVEHLLDCCAQEDIRVIVPLIDIDLKRLAPHKSGFADDGTTLVSPLPSIVELAFDKVLFEAFAVEHGIGCLRRVPLEGLADARYPLFAKRRRGFGSVGSVVCATPAEAQAAYSEDSGLMFQPLVEADEYSIDAFVNNSGECTVRVPRIRSKVVGGEAQITRTGGPKAVVELAAMTIARLAEIGMRGPLNVQIFASNPPVLLEVNPRLGSASVLSNMASGGRLFRSVLAAACGRTTVGAPEEYIDGLELYRFSGDVFHRDDAVVAAFPGSSV